MFGLVLAFLRERRLTAALNIALLAISVSMLVLLLQFGRQAEERFLDGAQGVDLVVGAKGSPLQLVLSAVYQLDQPTGNIPLSALSDLRANPVISSAIPLAMGDTFDGFRIVGTEPGYLTQQNAELAAGRMFERTSEVVIGSKVADATGSELGQKFVGSHGLDGGEGQEHDHSPFEVVGILKPSGTVADRLVLTSLESVWDVHGIAHEAAGLQGHGADHHAHEEYEPEITAILVKYRNASGALRVPPLINRQTNMQAASPAVESARLVSLFGAAIDAIGVFAWLLAITGGLAIFVALFNAVRSREGDLALLRVMGAGRLYIFGALLLEGVIVALLGGVIGIALAHVLLAGAVQLYPTLAEAGIAASRFYGEELAMLLGVAAIGLIASLLPAAAVYRGSLMPILNRN